MSEHSDIVGGSSAERVINCPASVKLGRMMPPQPTSSFAQEGTVCHFIMEQCLLKMEAPDPELIGQVIDTVEITKDLFYDKLVPAWEATLDAFTRFAIEEFEPESVVRFRSIPGAFGTVDILCKGRDDLVVILDYKFGSGHMVSPVDNAQLKFYGAAAIEDGEFDDWFDGHPNQPIVLGIIQPTDEHALKTWETTAGVLRNFTGTLGMAVTVAEAADTEPNEGVWCKYCPALAVCPKKMTGANAVNELRVEHLNDLSVALELAGSLEPWIKSVKKLAHEQLERGQEISGWKLVRKRAMRKWMDLDAVYKKLSNSKQVIKSEYTTEKILTPPQLEKLCKAKGIDFDKFSGYSESVSSGTTLAPESDKRQGVVKSGKRDVPADLAEKMRKQ